MMSLATPLTGVRHRPAAEIARRVGELAAYKNRPIVVYCRTQNRSAHAAS